MHESLIQTVARKGFHDLSQLHLYEFVMLQPVLTVCSFQQFLDFVFVAIGKQSLFGVIFLEIHFPEPQWGRLIGVHVHIDKAILVVEHFLIVLHKKVELLLT